MLRRGADHTKFIGRAANAEVRLSPLFLPDQMTDFHDVARLQTDLKFSADGETIVEGKE